MNRVSALLALAVVWLCSSVTGELQQRPAMTGEGPAVAGADVAAKVGSQAIPLAELEAKASSRMLSLRAQEYRIRRAALEDLIAVSLLEQEAAARNLTVDALIRLEVDDKARTVSDAEVSAVYESAADRFAGMPEAEARKTIAEGIRRQRVSQRRVALIKQLRVKADVRVFLTAPRVTVDPSNNPSRGPATAPITLVEFSDYECPYCGRIAGTLRSLEQRYRDRLRIVFRDFPLANHKQAAKAAEAASCAGEQGKYWDMHDKLFASQQALQPTDLKRYAEDIRLDARVFAECLDSGKMTPDWERDKADGERVGVASTPVMFVNGIPILGAVPLEEMVQIVEDELNRLGRSGPASQSWDAAAQKR